MSEMGIFRQLTVLVISSVVALDVAPRLHPLDQAQHDVKNNEPRRSEGERGQIKTG